MFPRSLVILWMVTGAVLAQSVRNRQQRPANHRTLFDETDAFSADSLPSNRARQQHATDLGDDMSFNIGPINHGQKPVNKPKTRGKIVAALTDDDDESVEVKPVVQTIRRYSVENEDGTFTFGYENADGTYKEETRGSDCVVRGKYGYVDPDGVKREFTYETGNPCVPGEERADDEEELNDFRPANPQRRPVKSGGATPRPSLPARERRPTVPQQRPQPSSTASPLIEEDDGETLFVPNRAPVQNRPPRPVATNGDDEEAEPVDVLAMKAKAALNSLRNRNQQPAEQQQQQHEQQHQQQQKQQRPPVVVRLNEPVRRRPASQPIESTINFDAEIERLTNSNTAGRPVNANNSPSSAPSDFEAELNRLPAARPQRRRPARPSQRALFTEDN